MNHISKIIPGVITKIMERSMGNIADDILEGDCCEICGEYFDDEGSGHPRRCDGCGVDQDFEN